MQITEEVLREQIMRSTTGSQVGPLTDDQVVMHTMAEPPEGFAFETTDNGNPVAVTSHPVDGTVYEYTLGEVKAMLAYVMEQKAKKEKEAQADLPQAAEEVEDLTKKGAKK